MSTKNLYVVKFEHYSQKDSEVGIKEYVLATSHEAMYEHLNALETLDGLSDLYYGRTLYGWEEIEQNVSPVFIELATHKGILNDISEVW